MTPDSRRWQVQGVLLVLLSLGSILASRPLLFRYSSSATADPAASVEKKDTTLQPVPSTTIHEGVVSRKPFAFFQQIRDEIDRVPWQLRCNRSASYQRIFTRSNHADDPRPPPAHRRIFYGSLVADEPWELFEIVGAETYGLLEGIVLVESNRTQSFFPRPFRHVHNQATSLSRLKRIFGTNNVVVQPFVLETKGKLHGLYRENVQRQEILKAWKKMGMGPGDVGYIADVDESFARDFLVAVQTCPYVAPLDYPKHRCHPSGRLRGHGRVYEGSPRCLTKGRVWSHPDLVVGACIEHIGDHRTHPLAPRNRHKRARGFATRGLEPGEDVHSEDYQKQYANVTHGKYPLWSAGDFRMLQGACYSAADSAFHFHNWLDGLDTVRHKYKTYGHPVKRALVKPIHEVHNDLKLMAYCLKNYTDAPSAKTTIQQQHWTETQNYQRVLGPIPKPWPVYFHDEDYRQRKHAAAKARLLEDEETRFQRLSPQQRAQELEEERARERKRRSWAREQGAVVTYETRSKI